MVSKCELFVDNLSNYIEQHTTEMRKKLKIKVENPGLARDCWQQLKRRITSTIFWKKTPWYGTQNKMQQLQE